MFMSFNFGFIVAGIIYKSCLKDGLSFAFASGERKSLEKYQKDDRILCFAMTYWVY